MLRIMYPHCLLLGLFLQGGPSPHRLSEFCFVSISFFHISCLNICCSLGVFFSGAQGRVNVMDLHPVYSLVGNVSSSQAWLNNSVSYYCTRCHICGAQLCSNSEGPAWRKHVNVTFCNVDAVKRETFQYFCPSKLENWSFAVFSVCLSKWFPMLRHNFFFLHWNQCANLDFIEVKSPEKMIDR